MRKTVNIIGAGFAGLSAAATLANMGHRVRVFEKNNLPGGRARILEKEGFRFDMGPTWYWMPEVFERFFNRFGKSASDYYQLKRVDPGYRMYFGKDDYMDIPADRDKLRELFEKTENGSAKKLDTFLKNAEYKYRIGIDKLVYLPGNSWFELLRFDLLRGMFKMDFFRSVSGYVRKEFHEKRLQRILEFPVIFLGATPQKTPALYTLMNYADLELGTWYPEGGMYSVVEAMKSVAEESGAEFYFHSPVSELKFSGHFAKSLVSLDQDFGMDALVAAADYHFVEQKLMPPQLRQYSEKYWNSRVMAPSSLLFFLGISRKLKGFMHHNLFFDVDFEKHAEEIYENPGWPEEPAIYVSNNTISDPSVAPGGMDNLIILIPVAPGLEDREEIREKYYHMVIKRLENITGQEIGKYVIFRKSYAHNDFIADYNSFRGNAYGLANTLLQTANFRPRIKNRRVPNMFYTGQLTLPGPGVPPAIISGQVVSEQMNKYLM